MNNLDTTTPISEFNVVDENGNVTAVPLSAGQKSYRHICKLTNNNGAVTYFALELPTSDVLTLTTLGEFLRNSGCTSGSKLFPTSCDVVSNGTQILLFARGIFCEIGDDNIYTKFKKTNYTSTDGVVSVGAGGESDVANRSLVDTVTEV